MMKTHYLCPVYWKWLQAHPEHARAHRAKSWEAATGFLEEGLEDKALNANGEAFEIAQAVILSLRQPDTHEDVTKSDFVVFGSLAIQLARRHAANAQCEKAAGQLKSAQTQLRGIAPLYACHQDIVLLIHTIEDSLNEGAAFYERQQLTKRHLH